MPYHQPGAFAAHSFFRGSKYLLRRYVDPFLPPKSHPQEVITWTCWVLHAPPPREPSKDTSGVQPPTTPARRGRAGLALRHCLEHLHLGGHAGALRHVPEAQVGEGLHLEPLRCIWSSNKTKKHPTPPPLRFLPPPPPQGFPLVVSLVVFFFWGGD